MSYVLSWKNPAVDAGKTNITVPVAATVTTASSLTFTGKGSANYGKVQQENLMRLLEHFADSTAPLYPTVGQIWYDTGDKVLKLCTATAPLNWKSLAGIQVTDVGDPAPVSPNLGDIWFERTGALTGNLYVYTKIGRFPVGASTIGGWNQIWPTPMEAALRDEYDEVNEAVMQLIDDATHAGNGAAGRVFTYLTDFAALDLDFEAKYAASPDSNVQLAADVDLRVQPYSGDWDTLLSAARWALSRLDIPATMYQDISPIPFVQDGRQAPASLIQSWMYNDVRFPTLERRTSRRFGMVTMSRLYAETMNVLSIAYNNRYNIRGMSGNSGTITSFGPEIGQYNHNIRSGSFGGGSGEVSTVFRWASDEARNRFIYGGNAIELTIAKTQPGAASSADTAVNAFLAKHNRFRITADKVRAMIGAAPYTMAVAAATSGLKNAVDNATTQTLAVFTEGTATLTIQALKGASSMTVLATLNTPAGVTGTTTVTYRVIRDCTAYGGTDTDLFPAPTAYVDTTDKATTTAVFTSTSAGLPPVANFSASSLTATSNVTTVVFTWTGTGATTVEWDLDNDGVFEVTGNSVSKVFTASGVRQTIRVRGTNSTGSDVLTRNAYIVVS